MSAAKTPQAYSDALKNLEKAKYEEAQTQFETFLAQNPVSRYSQAATFHIGYAQEMRRQWSEAASTYREVINSTGALAPRLQAMALYRLSYCLEALGQDPETVVTLIDVMNRKRFLPPEVANAEVPARLAAAYARVGNLELAHQFYKQAEDSMIQYRRIADASARPEWLARTLYHMGRLNLRETTWENFETVIKPVEQAQEFLLEAAELGHQPWSKMAAEELGALYHVLWQVVQTPPESKNSEILVARANQERQWEMTFVLVDLLDSLRRHRVQSEQKVSEEVVSLFNEIEKVNSEIKKLLAEQKVGSELTPAARKRILSQRPLPKHRSKPKTTKPQQEPQRPRPSASPVQDPNL